MLRLRVKGIFWDNGKENGNYYSIMGYILGYTGIMEKKMETTIMGLGFRVVGLGFRAGFESRAQGLELRV